MLSNSPEVVGKMDMLRLDPYSLAALQTCKSMLQQASSAGLSIEDLSHAIDLKIQTYAPQQHAMGGPRCPDCGKKMTEWPHSSAQVGRLVIGCVNCHYSRVETGE